MSFKFPTSLGADAAGAAAAVALRSAGLDDPLSTRPPFGPDFALSPLWSSVASGFTFPPQVGAQTWPAANFAESVGGIVPDASAAGGIVNTGTSLTWSHTCSTAANRILFVAAFGNTTDVLTGATYAGTAMTLAAKVQVPSDRYMYVWYLTAPATGANNVVVSASSSVVIAGASQSYTGAAQTAPDVTATPTGAASSSALTGSITTVTANDWVFAAFRTNNGTESFGSGVTLRSNDSNNGILIGDNNGPVATPGAVAMTATATGTSTKALILVAFAPAVQPPITDFALAVDSNPTGTETDFQSIVYTAVTPVPRGWSATATLAGSGVNVAVQTLVEKLGKGIWRKTITLTATALTTVKLAQAHVAPAGYAPLTVGFESTGEAPNSTTALPVVGVANNLSGLTGDNTNTLGMIADDGLTSGWGKYPSPGYLISTTVASNGTDIGLQFGYGFSAAKAMVLTANVPKRIGFTYFMGNLTAGNLNSWRDMVHYASALSQSQPAGDRLSYVLAATAKGRLSLASAADTSGAWMDPAGTYGTTCYVRDGFWTQLGLHDATVSRQMLTRFAANINGSNRAPLCAQVSATTGAITYPYYFSDDSNALLLIWALWHLNAFGETVLTTTQRDALVTGITSNLNGSGYWQAQNYGGGTNAGPVGWMDSLGIGSNSLPTTHDSALMQGLTYVALRAGQLLGSTVASGTTITAAKTAYQSFYAANGGASWVQTLFDLSTTTSPNAWVDVFSITPDFWAQYILGETLLTNLQVSNHLDQLFASNVVAMPAGRAFKCIATQSTGAYLASAWFKTFVPGGAGAPAGGVYQNGGSWLLHDFLALAVGRLHGYTNNDVHAMWRDRVLAEFSVDIASHEEINTSSAGTFALGTCTPGSWGYGWNAAILALETFSGLKR